MDEVFRKLSYEFGIPVADIKNIYKSYWEFIKSKIEELPLKSIETEEEFNKLRTCFSMKNLGKLSCTKKRFFNIKKKLRYYESSSKDKTNG